VVGLSLYDLLRYEPMLAMLAGIVIGLGWHRPALTALSRLLNVVHAPPVTREIGKAFAMLATFSLSLAYIAGSTFNPFLYFRF
jgi:hypothetical protein